MIFAYVINIDSYTYCYIYIHTLVLFRTINCDGYVFACTLINGLVCVDSRTKVEFSIGGESFHCVGHRILEKGFTSIMPWLAVNEKNLPQFTKGEKIEVVRVELYEVTY